VCGTACNDGYHKCSGDCVSNKEVATCGTRCTTPCVTDIAHAVPTCDGTSCGFRCAPATASTPGYHQCGTASQPTCLDESSTASCGTRCSPCPGPEHSTPPTCEKATPTSPYACVFGCVATYHLCGTGASAACFASDDPAHCGNDCVDCGEEICVDGQCSTPDAGP
jgi:hypothetical protein